MAIQELEKPSVIAGPDMLRISCTNTATKFQVRIINEDGTEALPLTLAALPTLWVEQYQIPWYSIESFIARDAQFKPGKLVMTIFVEAHMKWLRSPEVSTELVLSPEEAEFLNRALRGPAIREGSPLPMVPKRIPKAHIDAHVPGETINISCRGMLEPDAEYVVNIMQGGILFLSGIFPVETGEPLQIEVSNLLRSEACREFNKLQYLVYVTVQVPSGSEVLKSQTTSVEWFLSPSRQKLLNEAFNLTSKRKRTAIVSTCVGLVVVPLVLAVVLAVTGATKQVTADNIPHLKVHDVGTFQPPPIEASKVTQVVIPDEPVPDGLIVTSPPPVVGRSIPLPVQAVTNAPVKIVAKRMFSLEEVCDLDRMTESFFGLPIPPEPTNQIARVTSKTVAATNETAKVKVVPTNEVAKVATIVPVPKRETNVQPAAVIVPRPKVEAPPAQPPGLATRTMTLVTNVTSVRITIGNVRVGGNSYGPIVNSTLNIKEGSK